MRLFFVTLLAVVVLIALGGVLQRRARIGADRGSSGPSTDGSEMAAAQAREILGLGTHPQKAEVIAAHRRLMQKLHPDRGGSTFLAQQLNEAKRVLLKDL